jgi:acetylornithine aminotransferase/acetylornithine/N-succinyldiaminopimelate aminotransferase
MLTTEKLAAALVPGTHASTFGGNPVASAAAVATLKVMLEESFFPEVLAKSSYFQEKLQGLAARYPALVSTVRGLGLLLGLVLTERGVELGTEIVSRMLARGYIINFAGAAALRFVPPLIVTREEIDKLVQALDETFGEFQ